MSDIGFSSTKHRLHKGVGLFVEDETEGNVLSFDTHVIGYHLALDEVLFGAGIDDLCQGIKDEFWI